MSAKEYTSVGVAADTRDQLKKLRDGFGYDSYDALLKREFLGQDDEGN
jgi:hypothetical protein